MKALVIDVETSTSNKGQPYDQTNKLCYIGLREEQEEWLLPIEYADEPYGYNLAKTQALIDEADVLVLFNAKFDLSWLRRVGINFEGKRIHDCQLVSFILHNQTQKYPSLNGELERYGFPLKQDKVAEYWEQGFDTNEIPQDILEEYLAYDLEGTYNVYLKQLEEIEKLPVNKQRLISLHNQDLLTLQEIEWNGMMYDSKASLLEAEECQERMQEIDSELANYHSVPNFNASSGDHLSCLLYGGTITIAEQYENGVYKTGAKAGQPKFNWREKQYTLPQLVKPAKKSALKKEGYYSTAEDVLKSLKPRGIAKRIIELLLERAEVDKLYNSFYSKYPALIEKMNWEKDTIHAGFNQVSVVTGRLSCVQPNLQQASSPVKQMFYSRYN